MIRALIFILIFVVGCINKPPSSSQYLEKGYFEDLSFLRESPEKNNVDSNSINEISKITGIKYGNDIESDIAFRVIADHVRAVSFCIADFREVQ